MHLRILVRIGLVLVTLFELTGHRGVIAAALQTQVEPCFKHHGRLSSQNGIALTLWLICTTRIVALDNDVADLPPLLSGKYLDMTSADHSYVYGDFDICPMEVDKPGHMRRVRVVGAENLVVQDVQALRPPFRLPITWPTEESLRKAVRLVKIDPGTNLKSEYFAYTDSKGREVKHGSFVLWYDNGSKYVENNYVSGQLEGKCVVYSEDAKQQLIGWYVQGKPWEGEFQVGHEIRKYSRGRLLGSPTEK